MKWRERWYTRAAVWMLIGAPFALAAAVLESAFGWSSSAYGLGFASGVVIATVDGRYDIHVGARELAEEPSHTGARSVTGLEIGTTPDGWTWTLKMRRESRWSWYGRVYMNREPQPDEMFACLPMMGDRGVYAATRKGLIRKARAAFNRSVAEKAWDE